MLKICLKSKIVSEKKKEKTLRDTHTIASEPWPSNDVGHRRSFALISIIAKSDPVGGDIFLNYIWTQKHKKYEKLKKIFIRQTFTLLGRHREIKTQQLRVIVIHFVFTLTTLNI